DEVDHGDVRAVVAARADIIPPAQVRVRDVLQILAAIAAGARIDCLRVRIEGAQIEIATDLRVYVELQPVVMGVGFIGRKTEGWEAGKGQPRRGVVVRSSHAVDDGNQSRLVRQV